MNRSTAAFEHIQTLVQGLRSFFKNLKFSHEAHGWCLHTVFSISKMFATDS